MYRRVKSYKEQYVNISQAGKSGEISAKPAKGLFFRLHSHSIVPGGLLVMS